MAQVKVDHDYPTVGNLKYITAAGDPVQDAVVRIFTKEAFDQGDTAEALAVTMTNSRGEWVNPVYLDDGTTYTVLFFKMSAYGPDSVEIVC